MMNEKFAPLLRALHRAVECTRQLKLVTLEAEAWAVDGIRPWPQVEAVNTAQRAATAALAELLLTFTGDRASLLEATVKQLRPQLLDELEMALRNAEGALRNAIEPNADTGSAN